MPAVRSTLRLSLVLLCTAAALALAGPKKMRAPPKPPPTPSAEVAISRALDTAEEKVGGCVLDNAGPAPWARVVRVKVSINGAGQVLESAVALEPDDAAAGKMRPCIEAALGAVTFPKSTAPLSNAEREWTFKVDAP